MPTRQSAVQRGVLRADDLLHRVGTDLRVARMATGLSAREVGSALGISHTEMGRIERAAAPWVTVRTIAKIASVLATEISLGVHPIGLPVRDKAHISLLRRFAGRLHKSIRWRSEVPIPVPGDRRSADGTATARTFDAVVEAETRLYDVQDTLRRIRSKQRDLRTTRAILLLADTRHNRAVIDSVPDLRDEFPIPTRACLAALGRGDDPGGDCLVIL